MILYLLFLVYAFIHFARAIYKSYQQGLHFGEGQNKIVFCIIYLGILMGQFTIISNIQRIIVFDIWMLAFLLVYTIIGIHNKANNSGELFFFYQKEVRKSKIYAYIGIGIGILVLPLVYFLE